jgi:hypothetical protein
MTDGDVIVERGAESLEDLARRAEARHDGVDDVMSEELDASAKFLRKLKPSAISARIRRAKAARKGRGQSGNPAPIVIVGGALLAGMLLARLIDATNDDD